MAERMMNSPQRDALSAIDDRLSSLEYEVGGLRVVVNEALLLEARSDSDRAVDRVISADGLKRGASDTRDALLLDENGALYNSSGLLRAIDGAMSHIARADESEDRKAIDRVRELHGRHDPNCPYGEDCAGAGLCLACREEYPCATIRALDGE